MIATKVSNISDYYILSDNNQRYHNRGESDRILVFITALSVISSLRCMKSSKNNNPTM